MVSSVVIISSTAMILDYRHEHRRGVDRIIASLEEQTSALQAARLLIAEPDAFGLYVDEFCATMDERISPGHHILVLDPKGSVFAESRHHRDRQVERALLATTARDAVINVDGHRVAYVRSPDADGHTFILAQYLDHVEAALHDQLVRRAFLVVIIALTIVLFIYLAVAYWVIGPLEELLGAARYWGARDFSARAPLSGPSDFQVVAREFNSMAGQLEAQEGRRLLELEQAREIQSKLLPRLPSRIGPVAIAAEYRPAGYVAGDLYDVFRLPGHRIAVVVLDVSGHGISAAILTGAVKMSLRRHLAGSADLSTAMQRVNHDVFMCTTDSHFVTSCVGIWDVRCARWTYCAAGHPGGVLLRNGKTTELSSTAPLLGVIPAGRWDTESAVLSPGDRLLLYTDGIVEAEIAGRPFGLAGLRATLEQTWSLSLSEQAKAVIQAIGRPDGDWNGDDATVVAVEFHAAVPEEALAVH